MTYMHSYKIHCNDDGWNKAKEEQIVSENGDQYIRIFC